MLEQHMRGGVIEEVERQIVSGDGTGENFTGILHTSRIQSQEYTADLVTTLRRAYTKMTLARFNPTGWVLHPSDIEALDLLREDGETGGFLLNGGENSRVFGPPRVVPSPAVPQGKAFLADWSYSQLRIREREHTLAATQVGDLFQRNQVMLRSEGRYGFQILMPSAFLVAELTPTP